MTEAEEPRPLSHYGRSKHLAEKGLLSLHRPGQFDVAILRPSMFYGPPVPDRHIDVYRRVQTGRMPLIGCGDYARSITYIDNLVQATRLALTHHAAAGEIFYVVDEPVYTTRQIVEAMAHALGVAPQFQRLPSLIGPLAHTADSMLAALGIYWQTLHLVGESTWDVGIDCGKARRLLGYHPVMELHAGIQHAVEWCRSQGKL